MSRMRKKNGNLETSERARRRERSKRRSRDMDERKRAPSDGRGASCAEGAEPFAKAPTPTVPVEVLDTVFEFLDGNGLLSCETVSYCWRSATDRTSLWKRACIAAFPHLGDYYFNSSPYACCSAYEGDWRETFLDGNRANRSAVLDWSMEAVGGDAMDGGDAFADEAPGQPERKYFPPFSLGGYAFRLLADPGGNPRVASEAQAAGAPPVEKGLSVYLKVIFQDDHLEDKPGGVGSASPFGFPPPPQQLGPGHPWGAWEDDEEEEEQEGANDAYGEPALRTAKSEASTKRDPHGLRHRRRRARTREGRAAVVSHVGDPSAIARECCAAFSLAAVNTAGGKSVVWVSSMEGDRFCSDRRSWGVHCLVPAAKIQDEKHGFMKDGRITVRLRVRLLFLMAHVYTTADLASHRGFGVVPVRGMDRPFHFHGSVAKREEEQEPETPRNNRWDSAAHTDRPSSLGESSSTLVGGPLPCLTFEVLRCTTLEEMERSVARTLRVNPEEIRLWVITQPFTDGPLAPRLLLSGKDLPASLVDDGHNSPSLFRLLSGDTVDETCRVRLWVEQRSDGGFWETEATDTTRLSRSRQQVQPQEEEEEEEEEEDMGMPVESHADGSGGAHAGPGGIGGPRISPVPSTQPTFKDSFAGVRLSCTTDLSPWMLQQQSTLVWGLDVGSAPPWQAHGGGAGANAGAVVEDAEDKNGIRKGVRQDGLFLVFLKALGLGRNGKGRDQVAAAAAAAAEAKELRCDESCAVNGHGHGGREDSPRYLTHAVLRRSSPLRSLFELTAGLLRDGTSPEELGAYIEDLPWVWQRAVIDRPSESKRNADCTGKDGGVPRVGDPIKRFFTCPPPPQYAPGSSSLESQHQGPGGVGATSNATGAASTTEQRKQGDRLVTLTIEEAGLSSGASICFFRTGQEVAVRRTYTAVVEELVEEMRMLLRREGPLGRVHLMKLAEVVEICESLGYQGFRTRIAHDQQRHVNPRETLEYIARGKQLAFICDSCGTQDFSGPRYHCLECPDYDLCKRCHERKEPAPRHRYLFTDGQWKRKAGFHGHTDDHELEEIFTVPADGCDWRKPQHARTL